MSRFRSLAEWEQRSREGLEAGPALRVGRTPQRSNSAIGIDEGSR